MTQIISTIALIAITLFLADKYAHDYKLRRHKKRLQDKRFIDLSERLNKCETIEDLQEWKMAMIFNLRMEDFDSILFKEMNRVYEKQLYSISHQDSELRKVRIEEGEIILNSVKP